MHPQAREQIRSARMSNGLSLRELGRRTGVTASLLSQIENGKSDPSVSTLSALVSELGLSLDALLQPEWLMAISGRPGEVILPPGAPRPPTAEPGSIPRIDPAADHEQSCHHEQSRHHEQSCHHEQSRHHEPDRQEVSGRQEESDRQEEPDRQRNGHSRLRLSAPVGRQISPVIRPPERQRLDLESGVVWERLTRGPGATTDALLVTYQSGATSSVGGKLLRHNGIEQGYLISGELTLQLGSETYLLRAGDSLEFDGSTPHVYCNTGAVPARGLWLVTGRDQVPGRPGVHPHPQPREGGENSEPEGARQPPTSGPSGDRADPGRLSGGGVSVMDLLQAFGHD